MSDELRPEPAIEAAAVDAQGVVVSDAPCRQCGYNLRGLNKTGVCPECASPVAVSVRGDSLRYAALPWVRQVVRGVRATTWGVRGFIVLMIGAIFFAVFLVSTMIAAGTAAVWIVGLLAGALGIAGLVCFALTQLGIWLSTAPDPSRALDRAQVTPRRIARTAPVALLLCYALKLGVPLTTGPLAVVLQVLSFVTFGVLCVGAVGYLRYMQTICGRIPRRDLANRAGGLLQLVVVLVVLVIGMAVTAEVLAQLRVAGFEFGTATGSLRTQVSALSGPVRMTHPMAQTLGSIVGLVTVILWLVLIVRLVNWLGSLTRALREQLGYAELDAARGADSH